MSEKPTTAMGAALQAAATKTTKVVKAKDAPPSQTPAESAASKKTVTVDDAIASAKKTVAAKAPATKKAEAATAFAPAAQADTDPAQFLQVGAPVKPAKPAQWFPETYTLATREGVNDSIEGKVIEIRLYSEGCTECASLVTGLEESELEKCHFSMGNIYCPAAHLRVRFVGQKLRLLHKMRKAQEKHDINRLMSLMAGLDELSAEDRLDVLKELGMLPPEAKKEDPKPVVTQVSDEQDHTEDR